MHCKDCRYYEKTNAAQAQDRCRRYPAVTSTTPLGWCGEFVEVLKVAAREPEPERAPEGWGEKPKPKRKRRKKK